MIHQYLENLFEKQPFQLIIAGIKFNGYIAL